MKLIFDGAKAPSLDARPATVVHTTIHADFGQSQRAVQLYVVLWFGREVNVSCHTDSAPGPERAVATSMR